MKTFCRECKFYAPSDTFSAMGECRVESPMVDHRATVFGGLGYEGSWPVVQSGDWCGKFKRRPK